MNIKRNLIIASILCLFGLTAAAQSHDSVLIPTLQQAIDSIQAEPDSADLLIDEARTPLIISGPATIGAPYHYGGKGPRSFDCAGFARYCYLKMFGITLPPSSGAQYNVGHRIKKRTELQRGDLVFFQGRSGHGGVGHTGIVTEVDTNTGVFRFIHAATHSGVIYSYSTEEYYARRYVGACRLLGNRKKPEDPIPPKIKRKKR